MTNIPRSPTVVSHPAMCACRQTNAYLPRRRKWPFKLFPMYRWFDCWWLQEKNASHPFRVSWLVDPISDQGNRVTGWYPMGGYVITAHMVSSWDNFFCCFRSVKEDKLLATARYSGRPLYFANNLSEKMWRGIRIMPRQKIPPCPNRAGGRVVLGKLSEPKVQPPVISH